MQNTIARQLRRARLFRGMTQESLARAVGKPQPRIAEYEAGVKNILATSLWDLAIVLDIPIEFFFSNETRPKLRERAPNDAH